ncbi:MAG: DnaD domain protein, partial [Lachnospiraceae bacterium]|nr:DnaD domain protein [Lachnospiraceae bacterium]
MNSRRRSFCFSNDLIDYLVASCVDAGHKTAKYMQAVAMAWYS